MYKYLKSPVLLSVPVCCDWKVLMAVHKEGTPYLIIIIIIIITTTIRIITTTTTIC
jgi:hypothetical protein